MGRQDVAVYVCHTPDNRTSGQLLCVSAALYFKEAEIPVADVRVMRSSGRKPEFFPPCGVFFSVSHAEGIWACAFAGQPVGFDVETARRCDKLTIAKRFFHPEEAQFVELHEELFFELWTAKESYVKFTGEGITDSFDTFSVVRQGKLASSTMGAELRGIKGIGEYKACLCAQKIGKIEWIEF